MAGPSATYVRYAQGTRDFLLAKLRPLMIGMNADLAQQVVGGFTPFALAVGSVANAAQPCLALSWASDTAARSGQGLKRVTITYRIEALIPTAGSATDSNFETARAVCRRCSTTTSRC